MREETAVKNVIENAEAMFKLLAGFSHGKTIAEILPSLSLATALLFISSNDTRPESPDKFCKSIRGNIDSFKGMIGEVGSDPDQIFKLLKENA